MKTETKEIEPRLFEWTSCPRVEGYFWMWDNKCEFLPPKPHIYYVYYEDDFGWTASTIGECGVFSIRLDSAPLFHFYGPLPFPPSDVLENDAPWENISNAKIAKGKRVLFKETYNDKDYKTANYLGRTEDFDYFVQLDDKTIVEAFSVKLI